MPYDKYRNWDMVSPDGMNTLKEQLLKDLSTAADNTDKMELLDGFEVYVKRFYRDELATAIGFEIARILQPFISSGIRDKIPYPYPISRPRRADRD